MSENEKKDGLFTDEDDFWSLDALLPPKEKSGKYEKRFVFDTGSVPVESGTDEETTYHAGEKIPPRPQKSENAAENEKLTFDKWLENVKKERDTRVPYGNTVVSEYVPKNPFIKKVTISADLNRRTSAERFITDAVRLKDKTGEFHGNVPFESYYPQYFQLSPEQTECYIGLRTCFNNGIYPEADRSYIYLYLYEILNLSDIVPEEKADRLSLLICNYKYADDKMFSDMCNWLSDVCLIYSVKIPERIFGDDVYHKVLNFASLKEFYLFGDENSADGGEKALMMSIGRYDIRQSKFYKSNKAWYDEYVTGAVCTAIKKLSETDHRFSGDEAEMCTLIHESYFGALCTAAVRKTIGLECLCLTRSDIVRRTVTDIIKYAENCLRSRLGIKYKLTTTYLSADIRNVIKKYFAERADEFPDPSEIRAASQEKNEVPEYEKLYEPQEKEMSSELARKIEESSWDVTEKLVSAFAEDEKAPENAGGKEVMIPEKPGTENLGENPEEDVIKKALSALLSGSQKKFCALAAEMNIFPGALMEKINEWALECDAFSDIILTENDGIFEIIPDYYEAVGDAIGNEVD